MPPARAVAFDFNGTLSHDEPILCEICIELCAERGRPLSAQEYFDELAGNTDEEIARRWLGLEYADVEGFVRERIARYRNRVFDGSTVPQGVRAAVRYAAERVPVAVVTGSVRAEVEPVLAGAGLADVLTTIVPADDVSEGKPHPEGYLRALELLDGGLRAEEVVAFEDTEAGVASAKAAGLRVLAVLGTLAPARLRSADGIVEAIDVPVMRQLLG